MKRLWATWLAVSAFALALLLGSPTLWAQPQEGAILLLPESDLDLELAEDLTEVLIASFLDKAGKTHRVIGKELFRKAVGEAKLEKGGSCTAGFELECYRQAGKDKGLSLVVVGRVGKAMGGFRLEIFKLSTTGMPDRIQRKRVPGELEQLIAEVEALAEWISQPDSPYLRVTVSEPGAQVLVDGQPYTNPSEPLKVTPGAHKVEASKEGFVTSSQEINCEPDTYCLANLTLEKAPEPVQIPDPVKDPVEVVEPSNPHRYLPWAIVSGSVAVLSGLGAGYFFLNMGSYRDDIEAIKDKYCANNSCTLTRAQFKDLVDPLVEDGNNSAIGATALGVLALAAAIGSGVLLVLDLTDDPVVEQSSPSTSFLFVPLASPDNVGFQLEFLF